MNVLANQLPTDVRMRPILPSPDLTTPSRILRPFALFLTGTHQFLEAMIFWRPGNLNLARRRASWA